ncbi:hypothetical protein LZG00_08625 [Rhodobacteraceae bacterium LMO-12]|nr:hypothetical protein [Rhodobacteraceae bacterium LMO-JJ12]
MHSNSNHPPCDFVPSIVQLPDCCQPDEDHFVVTPRYLGLGCDMIIGGASGPSYRVIDLSLLEEPVVINWAGTHSGSITDGADSLVFHGVEQIILPPCMQPLPQLRAS